MNKLYTFNDAELIAHKLKSSKDMAAVVETDTVMGIVSTNPDLIYQIKQRPRNKMLIKFVASIDDVNLTKNEKEVIKEFWPGKLTVIKNKVSYRVPGHPELLKIIEKSGPLYSSSANKSSCPCVLNADEAVEEFKDNLQNLIFVKGRNVTNVPSTVIDLDQMQVLRTGVVDGELILSRINELNRKCPH